MMKKSKLIALMLIVTLMLTGAVYAAWSQTVTVKGDVETGNVNVDIYGSVTTTNRYIRNDSEDLLYNLHARSEVKGITAVDNPQDDQIIDIELIEFYPGSVAIAEVRLENKGSIPMKVSILDLPELESFILDEYELIHYQSGSYYEYELENRELFNQMLESVDFMPGDKIAITIRLTMSLDADESEMEEFRNTESGNAYNYSIPFRFEQYNDE